MKYEVNHTHLDIICMLINSLHIQEPNTLSSGRIEFFTRL